MGLHWDQVPAEIRDVLRRGTVIPAHPLALRANAEFDVERQRALTRYYLDAGVGGVALGVHTTQYLIRSKGLYEPVLRAASETVSDWACGPVIKIAGLTGRTGQAVSESRIAVGLGYHAGLLNVSAFGGAGEDEIIEHCRQVAREMPLVGFYLLPEVGGIRLSADFWRRFAGLDNVVAIKIAPFNRYGTVDVVRGVVEAAAEQRVTLYTGNDDHIVGDLLTPFTAVRAGSEVTVRIRGGLLGHWSFWTSRAVQLLSRVQAAQQAPVLDAGLLALDSIVTDCNGAIYDAAHDFKGCIPGCHEVLRRQGLLEGIWCLDPAETLSPGQREEIDRVYRSYPQMNDDAFVRANLERWLSASKRTPLAGAAAAPFEIPHHAAAAAATE
jgi:dihydrodipicolinate synthase/N-acetylneuraminate lyase